jgi:hypothetical protein
MSEVLIMLVCTAVSVVHAEDQDGGAILLAELMAPGGEITRFIEHAGDMIVTDDRSLFESKITDLLTERITAPLERFQRAKRWFSQSEQETLERHLIIRLVTANARSAHDLAADQMVAA